MHADSREPRTRQRKVRSARVERARAIWRGWGLSSAIAVVGVSVEVWRWSDSCWVGKGAIEGDAHLFQGDKRRWGGAQAAAAEAENWDAHAVSQHGGVKDNGAVVARWEGLAVPRGDDSLRLCLAGSDHGQSATTAQHHARASHRRQSNLDATQGTGRRRSRLNLRWQRRTRLQVLPRSARSLAAKETMEMEKQGPPFRADDFAEPSNERAIQDKCPTVCDSLSYCLESEREEGPEQPAQKKRCRPQPRCRTYSVGGRTSETHRAHPSMSSETTIGRALLDSSASFHRVVVQRHNVCGVLGPHRVFHKTNLLRFSLQACCFGSHNTCGSSLKPSAS